MTYNSDMDPLAFETHTLANGITVYTQKMDVPFFDMTIQIPIGSAHSHTGNAGGAPGIAHYLEHMLFNRSKRYPERQSFQKMMQLKGGYWNAATYHGTFTEIQASAPLELQGVVVEGVLDHVYHPIFTPEDMAIERAIVANERNQRKYFPASSKLEHYLNTQWMRDSLVSKQQVFGTDEDLAAITPEQLYSFMAAYAVPGTRVVVGGGHDLGRILPMLEAVQTKISHVVPVFETLGWNHKASHAAAFDDLDTPEYYVGNCCAGSLSYDDSITLGFMLRMLTNSVHGPLYEWTRLEKGWTYGISYSKWNSPERWGWRIELPLNSDQPLEEIRSELAHRIVGALSDADLIKKEAERWEYSEVYSFQTIESRTSTALGYLQTYGKVLGVKESRDIVRANARPERLTQLYETHISPSTWGEVLAIPEMTQ